MKRYTQKELDLILENHKKWLKNENEGEQANLSYADLRYVDLRDANLSDADLSYADLRDADLSYADLRYADLSYADLRYVDLSYADLRYVDLRDANLRYADLSYVDLRDADLSDADLSYADLRDANLSDADLSYAVSDLRFVSLSCLGSNKRMTTYCFNNDTVWSGCFKGTLEEFEKKVNETHKNNKQYLKECIGAINYIRSLKEE